MTNLHTVIAALIGSKIGKLLNNAMVFEKRLKMVAQLEKRAIVVSGSPPEKAVQRPLDGLFTF